MSYRYALWRLFLRTLATRTRGSLLGISWLFLEPFLLFLLYTFVFGFLLKVRFPEAASLGGFALYLLAGLVPYTAFQESVLKALPLLPAHRDLLVHTNFPAALIPLAEVLASLVSELIGLSILLLLLALEGRFFPTWLLLPGVVSIRLMLSLGTALLAAVLYPFLRDLEQMVRMLLLALLFLTPILYPPSVVPEPFVSWQRLNPLFWLVEGYRAVLLEGRLPPLAFLPFAAAALGFLLLSHLFFRKAVERAKDFL